MLLPFVALMLVVKKLKATIEKSAGGWSCLTHNFFLPAGAPLPPKAPRHHALFHVDERHVRLVQARNEAAVIAQLHLAPAVKETKQTATGVGRRVNKIEGEGEGGGEGERGKNREKDRETERSRGRGGERESHVSHLRFRNTHGRYILPGILCCGSFVLYIYIYTRAPPCSG